MEKRLGGGKKTKGKRKIGSKTRVSRNTGHFVAWNIGGERGGLRNKGLKRHMFFLVKLAPPLREIA